ncbi:MAG: protein kinase domain-containing protein [Rubrivivax sp.]
MREAFDRLADLRQPQRDAALSALTDPAVAAEVRALLVHHDADTGGLLARPASASWGESTRREAEEDRSGQRLGTWRIVSRLGSGGMGEVWLARRDDGAFQGEAAVKVLRRGMDSAAVLARFAQERQALAQLAHPHIARLLDAGRTADGLPYFVMERVLGQPLDRACEGRSLEDRLQLFLQLADAVSHAHRRGLVHRDLKPSNVLCSEDGQVKLLDFGIAKALDPLEGADGLTTMGGPRPYTPHYASPEQVRGEPVTAATDVYSLGVVLYQLLTGARPTGRGATTAVQAARSVLEEEPVRPSRLSDAEAQDPSWRVLRARLAGDLDNILMKALRKEPARRYPSVEALAADLRAHLDQRPVSARPGTAAYVLWRFVQRNRWVVLAAGLGLLGLFTGLGAAVAQGQVALAMGALGMAAGPAIAIAQARQAAKSRDQAQARFEDLRQLAHHVLFDYHNRVEPLVGSTPVRQRLVRDALTYLDRLARAAPTDRALRMEIGAAYRSVGVVQCNGFLRPHLGDRDGATRSYALAQAWLEPLVEEDPQDDLAAFELAQALSARAAFEAEAGDWAMARSRLQRAAVLYERHLEPDRADLRHRLELARTHLRLTRWAVALREFDAAAGHIGSARAHLQEMARRQPGHPELDHVWVWVHSVTQRWRRAQGDWLGLREATEATRVLLERLQAQQPENARILEDIAGVAVWQLRAAGPLGDVQAAQAAGHLATERWGALARRDPSDHLARRSHLDAHLLWGLALVRAGAPEAALERLQGAQALVEDTARRWPLDPQVAARQAYLADALAQAHHALGETVQAQACAQQARQQAAQLCDRHRDSAAALTARLVVRLSPLLWRVEALCADGVSHPQDESRPEVRETLQALHDLQADVTALEQRRRLEDHDFAWQLRALPGWIQQLQAR